MPRYGILSATCAVAALLASAVPAFAVNQNVSVGNDKQLTPSVVTVNTGESVTWTWVGPDTDHVIESDPGQLEAWDSNPGAPDPKTANSLNATYQRAFTNVGSFTYHCKVHSQMQGTVTVVAPPALLPPTASFTVAPGEVQLGAPVSFDAAASTAPAGRTITNFSWDLDGNGSFETSTGTKATTSTAYSSMGTVTVGLQVTDSAGLMATTTRPVTVTALPVVTNPTLEPQPQEQQQATPAGPPRPLPAQVTPLLRVAGTQKVLKSKAIVVNVSCGGACAAVVSAKVAAGGRVLILPSVARSLAAGETASLKLKISAAALGAIRAALGRKKRVSATVTLAAGGGSSSATVSLKA